MHDSAEATHAQLTALLANGVAPATAERGGRIAKNTGDRLAAEFQSAVQAGRGAIQCQIGINELAIR
jgi:class 3 adenylate cyclase